MTLIAANPRPPSNLPPPPSSPSSLSGKRLKSPPLHLPLASRIFVRSKPDCFLFHSIPQIPASSLFRCKNLPFSTGEATLFKLFSKFGQIVEVKLARREGTRQSKGHAFIQYSNLEEAVLAMEEMDQKRFGGRIIYAEIAKPLSNWSGDYPISLGPPAQSCSATTTGMN